MRPIIATILTVGVCVGWLSWFGFWSSSIPKGFIEGMLLSPSLSPKEATEGYVIGIAMATLAYFGLAYLSYCLLKIVWLWVFIDDPKKCEKR